MSKIQIYVKTELIEKIRKYAEEKGMNVSTLFRMAVLEKMQEK